MWEHPAIMPLGPVRSGNLLTSVQTTDNRVIHKENSGSHLLEEMFDDTLLRSVLTTMNLGIIKRQARSRPRGKN